MRKCFILIVALTVSSAMALSPPAKEPTLREKFERWSDDVTTAMTSQTAKGWAVIFTVVGVTVQATYLINKRLPPRLASMSALVGIAAGWGIFSFGAPFIEQQASDIRALGFRQLSGQPGVLTEEERAALNELWVRIQNELSVNEQMARNVKVQALISIREHLFEPYRKIEAGNENFAIAQIAYCAVVIRRLFPELRPDDPDVTSAVHLILTRHLQNSVQMKGKILASIDQISPRMARGQGDATFYSEILDNWLIKR